MTVRLGDVVKSASVKRSDVAAGTKGRAVLLTDEIRAAYIGYDDDNKIAVYVDQELAIRYKMNPRTNYILLLGRLNTDMKGNVVGDEVVIEYLRLSEGPYEEFMEAYREIDSVKSIILKKEVKGEYSFVKAVPSKDPVSEEIMRIVNSINTKVLWELVENDCAKSPAAYEAMLLKAGKPAAEESYRKLAQGDANTQAPREIARQAASAPAATKPAANPAVRPTVSSIAQEMAEPADFVDNPELGKDEFQ